MSCSATYLYLSRSGRADTVQLSHCVAPEAVQHRRPILLAPMALLKAVVVVAVAIALTFPAELQAASAPTPAPAASAGRVVSGNVTGSFGNLCSSQAGILRFLEGATSNQTASTLSALNITIPSNLSNSAALQQIAQVSAIMASFTRCLDSLTYCGVTFEPLACACACMQHAPAAAQCDNAFPLNSQILVDSCVSCGLQIAWEYLYSYPLPVLA